MNKTFRDTRWHIDRKAAESAETQGHKLLLRLDSGRLLGEFRTLKGILGSADMYGFNYRLFGLRIETPDGHEIGFRLCKADLVAP